MLNQEQVERLREQLSDQKRQLQLNADKALGFTMNRDRDAIGRDSIDESQEESMYSSQLRLHDREKYLLIKIEQALGRIDAGVLDECEDCSEPIGFERLLARPMTTMCIECKEAEEQEKS